MHLDLNRWFNIISFIGGSVVTLVVSYIFYRKGTNHRQVCYSVLTLSIISDVENIKDLNVLYGTQRITNLFKSKIVMKNVGNTVVEQSDFAPSLPIMITTNGAFMFNDEIVITSTNKLNSLSFLQDIPQNTTEKCNQLILQYDYIAKNEEITFEIFHTGDISVKGEPKDGKFYEVWHGDMSKTQNSIRISTICSYITSFVGIVTMIVGFILLGYYFGVHWY